MRKAASLRGVRTRSALTEATVGVRTVRTQSSLRRLRKLVCFCARCQVSPRDLHTIYSVSDAVELAVAPARQGAGKPLPQRCVYPCGVRIAPHARIAGFHSSEKRPLGIGGRRRAGGACHGLLVRLLRRIRSSDYPLQACSSRLAQAAAGLRPRRRHCRVLLFHASVLALNPAPCRSLSRVVHLELDRVGCVLKADDFLRLELRVAIEEIVIEDPAGLEEIAVLLEIAKRLA